MILGIDLGTTYSVCSYIDDKGDPRIVENCDGQALTPSVVQIEDNHVTVGEIAKENSIMSPEIVISTVKNYMGQKHIFKLPSGQEYTPEAISGYILRKLVKDSSDKLGEQIKQVIITVPAYFTDAQREATKQAAELAGLDLIASINEPTAAALCFAHQNKIEKANIMVYDLGGGTFDVTVIELNGEDVEVKGTGGISHAGGRFFDEEIVKYVCEFLREKHDIDLEADEYLEDLQELYLRAEKCKFQLSGRDKADIPIKIGKIRENVTITREFFEKKVQIFYRRSESKMKAALRNAGMKISEIDEILLVGGSSKIPFISEKIKEFYGKEPSKQVHPDEAVAMGAALYGEYIQNRKKGSFSDVCSHSVGIVTIDSVRNRRKNSILIKSNTKLPTAVTRKLRTYGEHSSGIDITLTEGEFEEIEDVTILCDFKLELPEGLPKGTALELQIQLDERQMIHLFVDVPSLQMHKEFEFERLNNLSDDEVKKLSGLVMDVDVD